MIRKLSKALTVALAALAGVVAVVVVKIFRVVRRPSWPPPATAVESEGAQAAVEAFDATTPTPGDVDLDYGWARAASVEPFAEGSQFFPRILEDLRSAESSVHILMFGWKPGEVADRFTEVLEHKLESGVDVRILIDGFGSKPHGSSAEMYRRLANAGAEIVVKNFLPPRFVGLYPSKRPVWSSALPGRADHRKLYVVDGQVAWTGGAGIEDHFMNGEFHDVMVRLTGNVVRQAQAVFLTSFRSHGAPLPSDLGSFFPEPTERGSIPTAIVQVVPGGFTAATEAALSLIDGAAGRLDIMNPYLTDDDVITRITAAARRGVAVRVVVSERSNNFMATAALRHRYEALLTAGVEIWEYPGAVVHAKLIVADDWVQFGTLNLDAWALYRNFEIAVVAQSEALAARFLEVVFEPDIARSLRGVQPRGPLNKVLDAVAHRIAYFL